MPKIIFLASLASLLRFVFWLCVIVFVAFFFFKPAPHKDVVIDYSNQGGGTCLTESHQHPGHFRFLPCR